MDFRILGPVEILADGRSVHLGAAKERALLALLVLHANRPVPAERLIDLLWGDEPPDSAANTLQVYVSHLRRLLEPARSPGSSPHVLQSRPVGYLIDIAPEQLDLELFRRGVEDGRAELQAGRHEAAVAALRKALKLWRGPALADVRAPFVAAERTRLDEQRLRACEECFEAELALGRHDDIVGELRTLADEHPLREKLSGQLMLALYRCGRQAEASAVYHRLREALDDEYGIEPGPELQTLLTAILNQEPGLASATRPEGHVAREVGNNLPTEMTSFVGRGTEIAECRRLRATTRLLTLAGAGGVGKTRLGLRVAADALADYPDGVWLIQLDSLKDPALVVNAIATELGILEQPQQMRTETLLVALRHKRMLLVLDNCEHLVVACAQLSETLLRGCPQVHILATSREPLRIAGEVVFRVPSLSVPGVSGRPFEQAQLESHEAVRLFVERAQTVEPSFRVTSRNAAAVAEICTRLDGIPLALELAAARVPSLTVEQIAQRLDDCFQLLKGGSRTAVSRQQTLRAAIDWSYELLSEPEERLFARVSVFAGGFDLEAAEAICDGDGIEPFDLLDLLGCLVGKSLLITREQPPGVRRYRLLETLRQYARERLIAGGSANPVHERHAAHFVSLAEAAESKLAGPAQPLWLERLEIEHDNLRAAIGWTVDTGASEFALRLGGAMWRFWSMHGHLSEGRQHLSAVLAVPSEDRRSDVLAVARGKALHGAGSLASQQTDFSAARTLLTEGLAVRRALGDNAGVANTLNNLGIVARLQGDHATARRLFEDSLALERRWGSTPGVAMRLNNLGLVAQAQGDYTGARVVLEEALSISRNTGDPAAIANRLNTLAEVALDAGDSLGLDALLRESLTINNELGDRRAIAFVLEGFAALASAQGDPLRALRLDGAATMLRELVGAPLSAVERGRLDGFLDPTIFDVAEQTRQVIRQEGRAMAVEEAVAYALVQPMIPA